VLGGCAPGGIVQTWQDTHNAGQIFDAGISAQSSMNTFRLKGSGTNAGQPIDIEITLDGLGNGQGVITQAGVPINFVVANKHVYVKSKQMWQKIVGNSAGSQQLLQKIDDHWVDFTSAGATATQPFVELTDAAMVKQCFLQGPHGTLTKGKVSNVNGRDAVEIDDKGDKPGTASAQFFVATSDPHYMIRIVSKGNPKPGGPPAPKQCQSGGNTSNTGPESGNGEFDVLDINASVDVKPPSGALDLKSLGAG
jgi:hypothetical protein